MKWPELQPGDAVVPARDDQPPWLLLDVVGGEYTWLNLWDGTVEIEIDDPL